MITPQSRTNFSQISPLIFLVVVVAILYFAQEVLIPLALAMLLSFLLAPAIVRLERWGFNRIPAVLVVVMLTFVLIGGITWVVAGQLIELAESLPAYKENIKKKVQVLKHPPGGALDKATETIKEIGQELAPTPTPPEPKPLLDELKAPSAVGEASPTRPIPVEVVPPTGPLQLIRDTLGPLLGPLGTAGIVIVFTIFMLIEREDLRDRLIRLILIGRGKLNVTTQALNDAAQRVSRYLLMQSIVNATYGIPVGVGLYFIGIPSAALWGLLAMLLRFIPYVGPWIAAALPISLSIAISDHWTPLIWTIALFVVLELISNNVMEPWLYGTSTGLSPIAILVAAVFWTWLWGGVGLLLATPLTVCLAVLGRYVPQLEFLNILLGDEPVLTPEVRFYQRLLALDQEEAIDVVEEYLKEKPLGELYDAVLIPALNLAEQDRHDEALDENRQRFILESIRNLIEDLGERYTPAMAGTLERAPGSRLANVCILPARDVADELVGRMLAQLLEPDRFFVQVIPTGLLTGELLEQISQQKPDIVCTSALPPSAVTQAGYLCKRVRKRFPELKILVGLWNARGDTEKAENRLRAAGADKVVLTLSQAIEQIRQLTAPIILAVENSPALSNGKQ